MSAFGNKFRLGIYIFSSPKLLIVSNFSVRHSLKGFTLGLISIRFTIVHSIVGDFPSFFDFQIF